MSKAAGGHEEAFFCPKTQPAGFNCSQANLLEKQDALHHGRISQQSVWGGVYGVSRAAATSKRRFFARGMRSGASTLLSAGFCLAVDRAQARTALSR